MLAIKTRFHGPTNRRSSRITASVCERNRSLGFPQKIRRLTVTCEDRLDVEQNHHRAAALLIRKLDWIPPHYGRWIVGGTETGYVFVCDTKNGYDRLDVFKLAPEDDFRKTVRS